MKKVIVTGACGFLGKNLIRELLNRYIQVVAIDVKFDDIIFNDLNVTCINCKNLDMSEIEGKMSKDTYDCFFHLAWAATSGPKRQDYLVQLENVKLVCQYIELAKSLDCKRFIYASSINEMETYEYLQSDYSKPSGGYIYGASKLAGHLIGETIAFLNDIDFIPVIITNIFGVGENSARLINTTIRKLIAKEHCSFTEGLQTYDFIYISDAIKSIIAVAEKGLPFNRYYIGSTKPKPLKDFLIVLSSIVDKNADLGFGDLEFNGKDISYDQFDLHKVERDTGYVNEISFEEGVELTMEYIKEELKK